MKSINYFKPDLKQFFDKNYNQKTSPLSDLQDDFDNAPFGD